MAAKLLDYQEGPSKSRGLFLVLLQTPDRALAFAVLLHAVHHQGFSGEKQTCDRSGVLHRGAGYLGRVDDTCLHEILGDAGGRLVTEVLIL